MNHTVDTRGDARHLAINGAYGLMLAGLAWAALSRLHGHMDLYETAILFGSAVALALLGWSWRPIQSLVLATAVTVACAVMLYERRHDHYGADLDQAEQLFLLKYLLSSQSAILWMAVLIFLSTFFHGLGLVVSRPTGNSANWAQKTGTHLAWSGVFMALVGTAMRWYESHQIGPHIGHVPVSNLYEVFVLLIWVTTLLHLYFESRYSDTLRGLSALVMTLVSCSVGFLLWYAMARGAQEIQPLVPALQSWWMKVHVPANFIGYGTFAIAAMVALAHLLKAAGTHALVMGLVVGPGVFILCLLLMSTVGALGEASSHSLVSMARLAAAVTLVLAALIALRRHIAPQLPALDVLDDLMYRAIALGFAFFTIATVLGALWAAEAWGGYWSWDPKETWALIVWLNYAAWLHMRLIKGMRGSLMAWWALAGLLITTFAFLGVNMFLAGLHSYGEL